MNIHDKKLFNLFYARKISSDELKEELKHDKDNISNFILDELISAKQNLSSDAFEDVMLLLFIYKELERKDFIAPLCQIILEKWHYKHEDIASLFQDWKDPRTINSLFEAANTHFEYLDYDDSYALAVKCIWALGDIATKESFEKLKLLTKSENPVIKENACYQLKKHSII